MNSLRRYLVAIVAIAVAFAAGVALGGGPLQGAKGGDRTAELTAQNADLRSDLDAARLTTMVDDAVAKSGTSTMVDGRLAQSSVAIVVLPGVPDDRVEQMRTAVADAGAQVTSTIRVNKSLLDPARTSYVESVVDNALAEGVDIEPGADAYETFGRLAGATYTSTTGATALSPDVITHLDGQLTGSRLIALDEPSQARAGLVLVLDDGAAGHDQQTQARTTIVSHMLDGWASQANGGVVVGPEQSSAAGGLFEALSSDVTAKASTINAADSPMAPLLSVLTLVEVREGTTGKAYGLVDGTPVLPSGLDG